MTIRQLVRGKTGAMSEGPPSDDTRNISIWTGGDSAKSYSVTQSDIDVCLALPKKTADRLAYWRRVTGDESIAGHVMVWSTIASPVPRDEGGRP